MDMETVRWLISVAATVGGGWLLINYRVSQLEKAVDFAKTTSDLAIAKAREDVRKELDSCWVAVHQAERSHAKHVEESYAERLKISERFTDVLLAQNTMAGEVKNIAAGVSRLEGSVRDLAEEVKKN
jgi:hypothetical protein